MIRIRHGADGMGGMNWKHCHRNIARRGGFARGRGIINPLFLHDPKTRTARFPGEASGLGCVGAGGEEGREARADSGRESP